MEKEHQGRNFIRNLDLLGEWFEGDYREKESRILKKIALLLNIDEFPGEIEKDLTQKIHFFCLKIAEKYKDCFRNKTRFLKKYEEWLNCEFILPENLNAYLASSNIDTSPQPGSSRGRPQKPFDETSIRTKKRRVEKLVQSTPAEVLSFAAKMAAGNLPYVNRQRSCISSPRALALMIDLGLSERKYCFLRTVVNSVHTDHKDCFPSKHALRDSKKQLLPSKLQVSEISAEYDVQDILLKTVESLLQLINIQENLNAKLICKWGFDGSGGHSLYKQRFLDSDEDRTDEFFFLIAFVPLKLIDTNTREELWSNPRPSSTFYCRPLKFIFMKENAVLVRDEENKMNQKINELVNYTDEKSNINIEFEMLFTMLDGSVSNILSGTNATSNCTICGATPKQMNSESIEKRTINVENLRFGLSTLHCWIRWFECLLHIAYRLPFKTWQVRNAESKTLFEQNKKRIQLEFKNRMGLIVDKPKQGFGSSNDGNTARRFFRNSTLSAEITRVDKELIDKFSLILRILCSGYKINLVSFQNLLTDTKKLYLTLYSWYYMPSSVHKVLVHGCDVVARFDLPIGQLSEDALEARHKEVRKIRLEHTRKTSRLNTNTDLINYLALTSDPLISTYRQPIGRRSSNTQDLFPYVEVPESSESLKDYSVDLGELSISSSDESE